MPLITLVLYLALIGLIVWLVIRFIPMPAEIQKLMAQRFRGSTRVDHRGPDAAATDQQIIATNSNNRKS